MTQVPQIRPSQEAKDALDRAIGHAMGRWQYVETALFSLSHCLMDAPYKTSSLVFFHITSAESKISLTDKLVQSAISERVYRTDWKAIRREFTELLKFRNSLAHFEVNWIDVNFIKGKSRFPIALTAHHLDTVRMGKADNGLFVETIEKGGEELLTFSKQILSFTVKVVPDLEQRVKELPQGLQQALETIGKTETPQEPLPLPKSSPT